MAYDSVRVGIQQNLSATYNAVAELFASRGEKFDEEDAERLETNPPSLPSFPFMIVSMTVIKDLLDIPLDLSLVFAIAAFFLSIFISTILMFWTFGKISGGWWKKSLIRWLWVRFFIMLGVEIIPFVNMIPANTIFVLLAHYKETKIAKLFNEALEMMHGRVPARVSIARTLKRSAREEWRRERQVANDNEHLDDEREAA